MVKKLQSAWLPAHEVPWDSISNVRAWKVSQDSYGSPNDLFSLFLFAVQTKPSTGARSPPVGCSPNKKKGSYTKVSTYILSFFSSGIPAIQSAVKSSIFWRHGKKHHHFSEATKAKTVNTEGGPDFIGFNFQPLEHLSLSASPYRSKVDPHISWEMKD